MRPLNFWEVADHFGKKLAPLGRPSFCPIRKHTRTDKTFRTFVSKSGDLLYKCWSCDPPLNVGDSVGLYAALGNLDRKTAWLELKDAGYEVPGLKDEPRQTVRRALPSRRPLEGDKPKPAGVLPLDLGKWRMWQEQRLGAVEKFAASRMLDAEALRKLDVVDIDLHTIGFGYRDPATGLPCRVKIRPIDRKAYWIEPKPPEGVQAKALGPLYLAHSFKRELGIGIVVVVTEGEVDALTLRSLGIPNVVSLPDGSLSAARVDLFPLWNGTSLLLSATDADEEGIKAHQELLVRTMNMGVACGRLTWQRDGSGVIHKDANDALMAGFTRQDFDNCMQRAADEAFGFAVNLTG